VVNFAGADVRGASLSRRVAVPRRHLRAGRGGDKPHFR